MSQPRIKLEPLYPGAYDFDVEGVIHTRLVPSRQAPVQNYPEQAYLIHDSLYSGYEAYDYQNPNLWQSRNVLVQGTLDPAYGVYADTPVDIMNNVSRTVNNTFEK